MLCVYISAVKRKRTVTAVLSILRFWYQSTQNFEADPSMANYITKFLIFFYYFKLKFRKIVIKSVSALSEQV